MSVEKNYPLTHIVCKECYKIIACTLGSEVDKLKECNECYWKRKKG